MNELLRWPAPGCDAAPAAAPRSAWLPAWLRRIAAAFHAHLVAARRRRTARRLLERAERYEALQPSFAEDLRAAAEAPPPRESERSC